MLPKSKDSILLYNSSIVFFGSLSGPFASFPEALWTDPLDLAVLSRGQGALLLCFFTSLGVASEMVFFAPIFLTYYRMSSCFCGGVCGSFGWSMSDWLRVLSDLVLV